MKKILLSLVLSIAVLSVALVTTPKVQAATCNGNPYIITYVGINFTLTSKTWCSTYNYEKGDSWYSIAVANVGEAWNDNIGSIKMVGWPYGSVLHYYLDQNYNLSCTNCMKLTTTVNSTPETIPNVYAYHWPTGLGNINTISSFDGISP